MPTLCAGSCPFRPWRVLQPFVSHYSASFWSLFSTSFARSASSKRYLLSSSFSLAASSSSFALLPPLSAPLLRPPFSLPVPPFAALSSSEPPSTTPSIDPAASKIPILASCILPPFVCAPGIVYRNPRSSA